jgi:hypothetical protein
MDEDVKVITELPVMLPSTKTFEPADPIALMVDATMDTSSPDDAPTRYTLCKLVLVMLLLDAVMVIVEDDPCRATLKLPAEDIVDVDAENVMDETLEDVDAPTVYSPLVTTEPTVNACTNVEAVVS